VFFVAQPILLHLETPSFSPVDASWRSSIPGFLFAQVVFFHFADRHMAARVRTSFPLYHSFCFGFNREFVFASFFMTWSYDVVVGMTEGYKLLLDGRSRRLAILVRVAHFVCVWGGGFFLFRCL